MQCLGPRLAVDEHLVRASLGAGAAAFGFRCFVNRTAFDCELVVEAAHDLRTKACELRGAHTGGGDRSVREFVLHGRVKQAAVIRRDLGLVCPTTKDRNGDSGKVVIQSNNGRGNKSKCESADGRHGIHEMEF